MVIKVVQESINLNKKAVKNWHFELGPLTPLTMYYLLLQRPHMAGHSSGTFVHTLQCLGRNPRG